MAANTESGTQHEPYPVAISIPVAWGDMDAFNHVNNTVYFRYFETARIAYFEKIGVLTFMEQHGIGPILAHTECRFRLPLTYPDSLNVESRVIEVAQDRFLMQYRITSHAKAAVAAEGTGRIVMVDYRTGKKSSLPPEVRQAITAMEGRDFSP